MKPFSAHHGATLLAGVAGFVDTLGFVALFGLFTAHVTGNFVLIGAELVQPGRGVALKLLAFPVFVLAVALCRWLALALERQGRPPLGPLMGLQAMLLLAFMAAGVASELVPAHFQPLAYAAGLFGAGAMGMQNASSKMLLAKLTPNTVMTGNVTQLVMEASDWIAGRRDAGLGQRISRLFYPVLTFALGSIAGALSYSAVGFVALLLPVTAITCIATVGLNTPEP